MLSNSDIWLPRERDNVLTEIPQLVLCHWEEARVKKMGAVLCTDSNRQEKLLGALCWPEGWGWVPQWDGGWAELPSCFLMQECPATEGMFDCKLVIKNSKNSIPWRYASSHWCRNGMGLIPELWDWTERWWLEMRGRRERSALGSTWAVSLPSPCFLSFLSLCCYLKCIRCISWCFISRLLSWEELAVASFGPHSCAGFLYQKAVGVAAFWPAL